MALPRAADPQSTVPFWLLAFEILSVPFTLLSFTSPYVNASLLLAVDTSPAQCSA